MQICDKSYFRNLSVHLKDLNNNNALNIGLFIPSADTEIYFARNLYGTADIFFLIDISWYNGESWLYCCLKTPFQFYMIFLTLQIRYRIQRIVPAW